RTSSYRLPGSRPRGSPASRDPGTSPEPPPARRAAASRSPTRRAAGTRARAAPRPTARAWRGSRGGSAPTGRCGGRSLPAAPAERPAAAAAGAARVAGATAQALVDLLARRAHGVLLGVPARRPDLPAQRDDGTPRLDLVLADVVRESFRVARVELLLGPRLGALEDVRRRARAARGAERVLGLIGKGSHATQCRTGPRRRRVEPPRSAAGSLTPLGTGCGWSETGGGGSAVGRMDEGPWNSDGGAG